ncbi:acyl-[acyl-carrier-protein]--UDP-N-acetylglucosamine O-acyltransferase [Ranunculus cassubicifolius]
MNERPQIRSCISKTLMGYIIFYKDFWNKGNSFLQCRTLLTLQGNCSSPILSYQSVCLSWRWICDVPKYMMVSGDRAQLLGLNLEGLRRTGFSSEEAS